MPAPAPRRGIGKSQARAGFNRRSPRLFSAAIGAADEPFRRLDDGLNARGHLQQSDLVPLGFQRGLPGFGFRAGFQFGGTVAAAEIGEVDRGLRIHLPVEQRDQRFCDEADDLAAAGRADHRIETPERIEDQGRGHRGARPLARLDAVGDGLAVFLRQEGEIGQLVVEQEAALGHQPRAETILDRRGHRDGIAVAVDDRDVAGAVLDAIGRRQQLRALLRGAYGAWPGPSTFRGPSGRRVSGYSRGRSGRWSER